MRPRGKAVCKSGHSIPTGWVDDKAVAKRAHASVKPRPSLRACGARPSAGRLSKPGWFCGENPGITRKAVFSEGRTPCVRIPMLDANRGIT